MVTTVVMLNMVALFGALMFVCTLSTALWGVFSVLLFQHCYSLEGFIIPIRRNHAIGKTQIIQPAAKRRDYNSNLFPKQHKNS